MNVEKVLKYTSIVELISVGVFLMLMIGGLTIPQDTVFYSICAVLSNACWYVCGLTFAVLIILLMIWFWRLLFNIASGTTPLYRSRELTPEKTNKTKFPLLWVLSSMAAFVIMFIIVAGFVSLGQSLA